MNLIESRFAAILYGNRDSDRNNYDGYAGNWLMEIVRPQSNIRNRDRRAVRRFLEEMAEKNSFGLSQMEIDAEGKARIVHIHASAEPFCEKDGRFTRTEIHLALEVVQAAMRRQRLNHGRETCAAI